MPDTTTSTSQKIALDKIKPSPTQARKDFNLDDLKSLAESIKEHGLQQPVSVRPVGDGFELIAGERRLRAVKLLGWHEIDATIHEVQDSGEAAVRGLIENLQREDLNPVEEAQGYKRLSDTPFGLSHEDIATKVGVGRTRVTEYLALLALPQEVQEIVARATISESHAQLLLRLPDKAKQIALAQQADKEGWSVKQTEQAVNKALGKPEKAASPGRHPGESRGPETSKSLDAGLQSAGMTSPPDPLAEKWRALENNPALAALTGRWGVHFGPRPPQPDIQGPMATVPGWNFWVSAATSTPPATISGFLQEVVKILIPGQGPATKWEQEQAAYAKVIAERTAYIASHLPASPPPPKPTEEEEPLDPKVAAMVAEHMAKGGLL